MQHCSTLNEYAQYVARVRHYASDMPLNQAVKRAVDECIREGILAEFLTQNRNEVISMSIFEYDKELEEKKLRKAEYEAGFSEGEKHGIVRGTFVNSIDNINLYCTKTDPAKSSFAKCRICLINYE